TWFFETFILRPHAANYRQFDKDYAYLFNSYYVQLGERYARPQRGLVTRPTLDTVLAYRAHVDAALERFLAGNDRTQALDALLELGCHHEMQHQELLMTDLLHALSFNPLRPAYRPTAPLPVRDSVGEADWHGFDGGIFAVGHDGGGFAFDCEGPRHDVLLRPFKLASRPVTNGEWAAFIEDGGYRTATLWLSDGWSTCQTEQWQTPLYWWNEDGVWWSFGMRGAQPVNLDAPVSHISFYEADAYARWAGKRLPLETEWEVAATDLPMIGNFMDSDHFRPRPADTEGPLTQMMGDIWEWTASPFTPYPGYQPPAGAVGEYNGKFMCNQFVLRGGSCVTAKNQMRTSYRNFFYPHQRWQFSGLRLAEDS
ncbi:MAG: ergothioneine biosynthesis protein EgtB, partial [Pseudomonadota bacterium]